ncbi:alpha/beta hydrolase [Streptomyces sp. NPDC047002]|uniref:alpha/beta hydrolase n=1 Tax=Streptomyces sp. NPDC047002 TaxID=3155475 RepID=UPI003455DD54
MGSPELQHMAAFYEDMAAKFLLTDNIGVWRDISESLHLLASEPEGVTYREVDAGGVPALWAVPAGSSSEHVLLHSHSGGSVVASPWMDRKAVGHLARATGVPALLVDFRLAPEHAFPAQTDDVRDAYRWLLDQGYEAAKIATVGHSIGGNYAVNLALVARREGLPLPGAVLSMSPWFDIALDNPSIDGKAELDKMLSRTQLTAFGDLMLEGTGVAKTDPRINLQHADLAGLPPTFVLYGDQEILTDDSERFAVRARAAGVHVRLEVIPGGQHNFLFGAGKVPEIDEAVGVMAAWLREKLGVPAS